MKKTKILFLIGSYGVGGKERQLRVIIENLPQHKYEIYLLVKSSGPFLDGLKEKLSGFRNLEQPHFNFKSVVGINAYLNDVKPDIVFSFAETTSHIALFCKILTGKKFKLINGAIRNAPDHLSFIEKIEAILYNLYPIVVANSYAGLKAYGQDGKKGRHVLYNGCFSTSEMLSAEVNPHVEGISMNTFNVVMIGSFRRGNPKDPATFIRAAAEVQKVDSQIRFYLVGDGETLNDFKEYAASMSITNLSFLGNRMDVAEILRISHLSVLTSRTEGISNSILESMSFGVPVIATSKGGTPELIASGENGFIVPFQDYNAIANLILELKQSPHRLQELGTAGKTIIRQRFSINSMIKSLEEILRASS